MKKKYKTVYQTGYGVGEGIFKEEMELEEAEKIGMDYCNDQGFEYIRTEESND